MVGQECGLCLEVRTLGSAVVGVRDLSRGKRRSREERLGAVPEIHTLHPGQSLPAHLGEIGLDLICPVVK